MKRRVIIESPYAAPTERERDENVDFALACVSDSLHRGEAPIAFHAHYTMTLEDTTPEERELGMDAAQTWYECADAIIVYCDRGVSQGMETGIELARLLNKQIEYRYLEEDKFL